MLRGESRDWPEQTWIMQSCVAPAEMRQCQQPRAFLPAPGYTGHTPLSPRLQHNGTREATRLGQEGMLC